MNKWSQSILSNELQGQKNNTDLSPMSPVTPGALYYNLKNRSKIPSDNTDKSDLSLLSPINEELSYQNLNKGPGVTGDIGDKSHLSGLSGKNWNSQDQNLESIPEILTDKPDREIQSIIDDFEERCAIVEYDGGKTALEAQCTAYREAFFNLLSTYYADNILLLERS